METWILHHHARYQATPWPFAKDWDAFLRSPEPLVHAVDDFGRDSPRDYLSETPAVPAHLPRGKPRGRYAMAIYHDADFLYVLLDAAPPAAVAGLEHDRRRMAMVNMITADQRTTLLFADGDRSQLPGYAFSNLQGSRADAPPSQRREERWDFHALPRDHSGELCCWRIARDSIADVFVGPTLSLSVSYASFAAIEAVAWGAYGLWGPRVDEMGVVELVPEKRIAPWPVLRRIEMDYEPATEQGRFRCVWADPYSPDERTTKLDSPAWNMYVTWDLCSLRLNARAMTLRMDGPCESDWLPIAEGFNVLCVASVGGPAVSVDLEKRTGNHLIDNDLPAFEPDFTAIERLIRDECDEAISECESRAARGQSIVWEPWHSYHAASLGRVQREYSLDSRLLDALRESADFHLNLQRDDGTYAGFHLRAKATIDDRNAGPRWAGGAYDTGPAGELWTVAAWLLGDEKYIEASRKLVQAYATYRSEFNHNYAAFALYHLAAHYRLTREPLAIEHGLYYCKWIAASDILPLGFQSGHNYYSEYGGITLRGLAQFCAVLPASEPYRATLRELCVRMANQVIHRQQDDGRFDARSRFWLRERWWLNGLFAVAFLVGPKDVAVIDRVVGRMLRHPPIAGNRRRTDRLADGDLVRYLTHRQRLLRGEHIDLLSLV